MSHCRLIIKIFSMLLNSKYMGVHVSVGQLLKFSVEHLKSKFNHTFNCIYSGSKA